MLMQQHTKAIPATCRYNPLLSLALDPGTGFALARARIISFTTQIQSIKLI